MKHTQRRGVLILAAAAALLALGAAATGLPWLAVLGSIVAAGSVALMVALESRRPEAPHRSADSAPPADSQTAEVEDLTAPALSAPREPATIRMPTALEPPAVVHALLENAAAAGDAVAAHLWLEDPGSATLRLVASDGPWAPAPTPVAVEGSLLGRALTTGSALLEPISHVRGIAEDTVMWRYAIPLAAGDARGVAAIDTAGREAPDADVLTALAPALRGALAGALALHVARTETDAARTLLETARDLSRLLDPPDVIRNALERAMELGSATTGSVMLLGEDGRTMTIAASKGLSSEVVSDTNVTEGEGIAGWVLASRQPLVVEDLPGTTNRSRRQNVKSAVSVPIADEDGILGVLNVGSREFAARIATSHLQALETLGRITAVALRNARAVHSAGELYFDTLKALALALETKDPYARGGTDRLIGHAVALGKAMGLTRDEGRALEIAAMLHDIGMSAAGEVVGVRQRQLSTLEWGLIKMHPVIAAEILEQAPALHNVVPIVFHHHEHFDGGGYVTGSAGEAIPVGSRILAVADAYVAMTSERPYRRAMTHETALAELRHKAGTQFDPNVVEAFADLTGSAPERVPDRRE